MESGGESEMKRSFLALHRRCCQAIEAGSCEPAVVDELYADLVRVAIAVDRSAMFSKNEELDDISTETLVYLYVDHLQGKILTLYNDRKRRRRMLERAKAMLEKFLSRCENLRLTDGNRDVFAADEEGLNPNEKRQRKIARYRFQKEARERIEMLQRTLEENDGRDLEEEARELYITQLQIYCLQAMEDLPIIQQEMEILAHMEQMEEPSQAGEDRDDRRQAARAAAREQERRQAVDPSRPGLSITKLTKAPDGSIVTARENVKARVLGSSIAPPTMSIEEFAELEKQEALEREQRQQESGDEFVRSYKQLEEQGKEDNEELVDKATDYERYWDEWKEHNPKGIGNKMGKLF